MAQRPLVGEYNAQTGEPTGRSWRLPSVFNAPIRSDVVQITHKDMSKNRRQANGVDQWAGHMNSAESWGTGRAVARIPRVSGGGTHRAGQGAFGNMCRGGHMFSPKVTWRRWHRHININQKRTAVAAAIAASAVPALVMARGHRIQEVKEIPLVLRTDTLVGVDKTKKAAEVLKKVGAWADIERVAKSRTIRAGIGKMRNRRYTQRLGPLLIYKKYNASIRAFRNIPGLDLCRVDRLNLLQLAPGAHLGRFLIWTSDAFAELQPLYGTFTKPGKKNGFVLPFAKMANSDLASIINSEAIQRVLHAKHQKKRAPKKTNPLVNLGSMIRLNPFAAVLRRRIILRTRKLAKLQAARKAGQPLTKKAKKETKRKVARKPVAKKGPKVVSKKGVTKEFLPLRVFRNKGKKLIQKKYAKGMASFKKFLLA